MPPDVVPPQPEQRRCQDCGTVAVRRTDEYGDVLVCPNDDCHNIVVFAMPLRSVAADLHDDLTVRRTERFVRENIGRAEREATAILAEHEPVSPDKVHALVSLAWGRGFVAGYGAGSDAFAALLDALSRGERS